MQEAETGDPTRIDKWLWASRFFKTRALAAEAVLGGKVHLNGTRVKPGKVLRAGDEVSIRRGPYEWVVIVRGLTRSRGPAEQARSLYEETEQSKENRERVADQTKAQGPRHFGRRGRPSKKDRREILRFIRGGEEPE